MTVEECINGRKFRKFHIIIYVDCMKYHTDKGCSLDAPAFINYLCKNACGLTYYAYIWHDLDVDDHGNPKKLHAHLYLEFENQHTIKALSKKYGILPENFTLYPEYKKVKGKNVPTGKYLEPDRTLCLQYLVHANDKDKYQYRADLVHTNLTGFNFTPEEDISICRRSLIEFAKTHTFEQTLYYAEEHGLEQLLKKSLPYIDRILKEREVFSRRYAQAFARTMQDGLAAVNAKMRYNRDWQTCSGYDSDGNPFVTIEPDYDTAILMENNFE